VFAFGDGAPRSAVHVAATDFAAHLARGGVTGASSGEMPFGGLVAATALAGIALEAALPRIEAATGLAARRPRPSPGPPVRIDLRDAFPELPHNRSADLGEIDAISGGAITHALLFCLLRVPALRVQVRVVEEQRVELSDVNRYALLRRSDVGRQKTDQLEATASDSLGVVGVPALFTKETRETILPLADLVVVGVDDVEARWWVQQEQPAWVGRNGDVPCEGRFGGGPRPLVKIRTENPDNHICFVQELRRELSGLPVAEVYSDLAHHFHHNGVRSVPACVPAEAAVCGPSASCLKNARAICERAALCQQTNSTCIYEAKR
jgi:hypothetical protein